MRIEDISQLPEAMQRQVREKMAKKTPDFIDDLIKTIESADEEELEHLRVNFNSASPWPAGSNPIENHPVKTKHITVMDEKSPFTKEQADFVKNKHRNKYGNRRVELNGVKFDSKKEAMRFLTLLDMEKRGEIQDLRLQPQFTLQEAYTTTEGVRVRAIRYQADFSYTIYNVWDREEKRIVEDVKSKATKTRVYEIKKKLLREKFHVEIREI